MSLSKKPARSGAILLLLFVSPLLSPTNAGGQNSDLEKVGRELKKVGRQVGDAGKEVGREIAGAAKQAFYKGKKVSAPLLRDVQRSTREYWARIISEKDKTIEKLRRENEKLKRRLGGEDREDDD